MHIYYCLLPHTLFCDSKIATAWSLMSHFNIQSVISETSFSRQLTALALTAVTTRWIDHSYARFYELEINLGIVNPRLVVYPEFIPGTTFCVLSTLWNRGITILGLTWTALASSLLIGQQMSRASLLILGLGVGHCHFFLAFFDQHFLLTSDVYLTNKKYVLWNVYLPNALHSVRLNRLSCTEVRIYNGANSSWDTEAVPKFQK